MTNRIGTLPGAQSGAHADRTPWALVGDIVKTVGRIPAWGGVWQSDWARGDEPGIEGRRRTSSKQRVHWPSEIWERCQGWMGSGSSRNNQSPSQGLHSQALEQVLPGQAKLLKHVFQLCRLQHGRQIPFQLRAASSHFPQQPEVSVREVSVCFACPPGHVHLCQLVTGECITVCGGGARLCMWIF